MGDWRIQWKIIALSFFTLTQIYPSNSKPAEKWDGPTAGYFSPEMALQARPEGLGWNQPPPEPGELLDGTDILATQGCSSGSKLNCTGSFSQRHCCYRQWSQCLSTFLLALSLWAQEMAVPLRCVLLGRSPPSLSIIFLNTELLSE